MRGLFFSILISFVASIGLAGTNPTSDGSTPTSGLASSTCAENSHWNSSSGAGSCELVGGIGQRKITIDDYADSASDIIRIRKCVAGDSCSTYNLTASATAVAQTSVVVAGYGNCADDSITVTVVDNNNKTNVYVLNEAYNWTTAYAGTHTHGAHTSNNHTANHLCEGFNTYVKGATGSYGTATCTITKNPTSKSVTVATSDATCATVTNTTDQNFSCVTSNAICAANLKDKLDILLNAGTYAGFSVVKSGAAVALIPSETTTDLSISIYNAANHALGTLTAGNSGSAIVRHASALLGSMRFCGNGQAAAANPVYLGPILPVDWVVAEDAQNPDMTFGSTWCDARESTTEATADAPWHSKMTIYPSAMVCVMDCGAETGDTILFSLRSAAAAADADMNCAIVYNGAASQCNVMDPTPTPIVGGATVAVKVTSSGADDCSTGDVECTVWFTY